MTSVLIGSFTDLELYKSSFSTLTPRIYLNCMPPNTTINQAAYGGERLDLFVLIFVAIRNFPLQVVLANARIAVS